MNRVGGQCLPSRSESGYFRICPLSCVPDLIYHAGMSSASEEPEPLAWLKGAVKTPPFSTEPRIEMPHSSEANAEHRGAVP
jgi:hypothetical protein